MAVDRVANFILSGIDNRFNMPNLQRCHNSNSDVGKIILQIDYEPTTIEIPSFYFAQSITDINYMFIEGKIYKYINSIGEDDYNIERKQLNTILNDFTCRGYNSLIRKVTNKDNTYYGYPGLITDSNFNTLVCFKVRMTKGENCVYVTDYLCYISPRVFSNLDGIIEKAIYKKFIPFCASYVLNNNNLNNRYNYDDFVHYNWGGKHIEVIISDDVECFIRPISPKIEDFKDDSFVKRILLDNIDAFV